MKKKKRKKKPCLKKTGGNEGVVIKNKIITWLPIQLQKRRLPFPLFISIFLLQKIDNRGLIGVLIPRSSSKISIDSLLGFSSFSSSSSFLDLRSSSPLIGIRVSLRVLGDTKVHKKATRVDERRFELSFVQVKTKNTTPQNVSGINWRRLTQTARSCRWRKIVK